VSWRGPLRVSCVESNGDGFRCLNAQAAGTFSVMESSHREHLQTWRLELTGSFSSSGKVGERNVTHRSHSVTQVLDPVLALAVVHSCTRHTT
jgi:hypothetical protein